LDTQAGGVAEHLYRALLTLVEIEQRALYVAVHQRGVAGLTAARLRLETALEYDELDRETAAVVVGDLEEAALRLRQIIARLTGGVPVETIEEALVRLGLPLDPRPDRPLALSEAAALVASRLAGH
jgi:hypothetical protein